MDNKVCKKLNNTSIAPHFQAEIHSLLKHFTTAPHFHSFTT